MIPTQPASEKEQSLAWNVWRERNNLKDLEGIELRSKLTKVAAIAVLLLVLGFWSYAAGYQTFVRFAVCAGALRVAFLAAAQRKHVWVMLFTGMALLYNPVVPAFALSGRLEFLIVLASVAPFAASLVALRPRLRPILAG